MWDDPAIIVTKPDGTAYVYRLPAAVALDGVIARVRAEHSIPAKWWDIEGWMFTVTTGEPHPTLMRRAQLRDWSAGVPA